MDNSFVEEIVEVAGIFLDPGWAELPGAEVFTADQVAAMREALDLYAAGRFEEVFQLACTGRFPDW